MTEELITFDESYLLQAAELFKKAFAGIFLQTDIDKPSFRFYTKNGFTNLEKHVSLFKGVKQKVEE